MGDLIKFEVGKIFPGPVPAQEGAQMELRHDALTVDSDAGAKQGATKSLPQRILIKRASCTLDG